MNRLLVTLSFLGGLILMPAVASGVDFTSPPVPHWSVDLPGGHVNAASHVERSRPLVHDGDVFLGSAAGAAVYRLSSRDGSQRVAYPSDASVQAEPVVVGEDLMFSDTSGTTWCYALDGEFKWKHQAGVPILTSPLVLDDTVLLSTVDDLVIALQRTDGTLKWRFEPKADLTRDAELRLYASPKPVALAGVVLVGFSNGDLVALDTAHGELLWQKTIGEGRYPDLVATPVVTDKALVVSGYYGPLVALDKQTRQLLWRVEAGAASRALVSPDGTLLYHPGSNGVLRALNPVTGVVDWRWKSPDKSALTQPVWTKAGLVVASAGGELVILDPQTGEQRWRYTERLLSGLSVAPRISGGQMLFVTNAGKLYSMLSP